MSREVIEDHGDHKLPADGAITVPEMTLSRFKRLEKINMHMKKN